MSPQTTGSMVAPPPLVFSVTVKSPPLAENPPKPVKFNSPGAVPTARSALAVTSRIAACAALFDAISILCGAAGIPRSVPRWMMIFGSLALLTAVGSMTSVPSVVRSRPMTMSTSPLSIVPAPTVPPWKSQAAAVVFRPTVSISVPPARVRLLTVCVASPTVSPAVVSVPPSTIFTSLPTTRLKSVSARAVSTFRTPTSSVALGAPKVRPAVLDTGAVNVPAAPIVRVPPPPPRAISELTMRALFTSTEPPGRSRLSAVTVPSMVTAAVSSTLSNGVLIVPVPATPTVALSLTRTMSAVTAPPAFTLRAPVSVTSSWLSTARVLPTLSVPVPKISSVLAAAGVDVVTMFPSIFTSDMLVAGEPGAPAHVAPASQSPAASSSYTKSNASVMFRPWRTIVPAPSSWRFKAPASGHPGVPRIPPVKVTSPGSNPLTAPVYVNTAMSPADWRIVFPPVASLEISNVHAPKKSISPSTAIRSVDLGRP